MYFYGYLMGAGQEVTGRRVEVSEERLHNLLRTILPAIEVDENWYRENNPDVEAAINAGDIVSARHHYVASGYFEDRLPHFILVDEQWYLDQNPDVAGAIRVGVFASAQEHFSTAGFREGRLPREGWSLLNLFS